MSRNVVSFMFTLRNKSGEVLDQTNPGQPLVYLEESEMIIPGLEKALTEMDTGAKSEVIVRPEEGYGFRDESQIQEVSRDRIPVEEINIGDFFQAGADQHAPVVQVVALSEDTVTLDANHPLAGQDLIFDVEVVEKRPATEEEIAHGHVHSDDSGCCGGGGGGGCGCH